MRQTGYQFRLGGSATGGTLLSERFKHAANLDMVMVPFKGEIRRPGLLAGTSISTATLNTARNRRTRIRGGWRLINARKCWLISRRSKSWATGMVRSWMRSSRQQSTSANRAAAPCSNGGE
jgi:hypothetical protein